MSKKAGKREIEFIARGVMVKRGCILICKNRRKKNTFLPGGHIEYNEAGRDALCREVREEMGVKSRAGRFLGACEHRFIYKGKRTCEINLVFELDIPGLDSSKPAPSVESHLVFKWVPLKNLNRSKLEPAVLRKVIPAWVKSRPKIERFASSWGEG